MLTWLLNKWNVLTNRQNGTGGEQPSSYGVPMTTAPKSRQSKKKPTLTGAPVTESIGQAPLAAHLELAIEAIKQFEGYSPVAYQCSADVWTIGYGRTEGVKKGDTTNREDEDAWLLHYVLKTDAFITRKVQVLLNDFQRAALISFVYNVGNSAFASSTLLKRLNEGKYAEATLQLLRWNKAGGKVVRGLALRREQEKALFERTI